MFDSETSQFAAKIASKYTGVAIQIRGVVYAAQVQDFNVDVQLFQAFAVEGVQYRFTSADGAAREGP